MTLLNQLKKSVPTITPVSGVVNRPFWSVMIPTYNCAAYLEATLESVLKQDPGAGLMQIVVVDDCSTDNPEKVVKRLADGRVSFFRQPQNVGAIPNFNTCIKLADGFYVHILHGDDYIEGSFYESIGSLAASNSTAALLCSRCIIVDEKNEYLEMSPRIISMEKMTRDASFCYYSNPFRTPAVVIKREFYERWGGFNELLCHTADWELWIRAISMQGGACLNKPLAFYRYFLGNDTNRLARNADNLRDYIRFREILQNSYPRLDKKRFDNLIIKSARSQTLRFGANSDQRAFLENLNFFLEQSSVISIIKFFISHKRIFLNWINLKLGFKKIS